MKRRSIRFKFFVAISAVTLVFIGVLLILNLFFYEDYYMLMRRGELRDAYQGIRNSYSGDIEEMMTVLDNYESQTAIRMAVVCSDGTVLYTSFNTRSDEGNADTQNPFQLPDFDLLDQQRRGYTILQSIAQNVSWNTLDSHSYQFLNVTLWDNDQYLCLAGVLDNQADKCLFAYMPYAYIEQNSSLNLVFLVIAGGCALLICLIFAYGVSRWFSRPLIAMAGLADRMSELDFSTKYQGGSTDEIGQLGQSLNRLSAYLEQTIRELRQSNEQLAQEIKEKERIDNMRQEFIVNVSHELKTPIALIQGYAEGLTAGVADDPEDRKYYCDTIADEADHMNKLVMQLLNLSRLELGAEQTYSEDIDLHELCAEAVRKTAVLCESRGLTVEYDDTCITVRTDGDLLDQVLMNYLSNAIRYTVDGGKIKISAKQTGDCVRLTVFNEGDGLPEEELPKIWEKFYRTDRARTREAGGTGIGLSLVRAIADTLHGSCGVENVEGGIVFWFELSASAENDSDSPESEL
ncbi:sensor histidine kinase [Agathobaculum sp.]|uniref:sensor histidine kinase n=1 Tax=Agathobaculum sp. TaxID=2048138 RepID=UPI001C3BA9F3|nr:HAMP domain-containing sensor histidine kinase [Agathobaculum sp.]HIX11155.1 HAMP domain-containing histidine kinase [Candidatus Agathobaculum pullistercoris]